jgi:hypothetical protein
MTPKQAIHILMLSPCYWRLNVPDRRELVREYCLAFAPISPSVPHIFSQKAVQRLKAPSGRTE